MKTMRWMIATLLLGALSAPAQWGPPSEEGLRLWPAPAESESFLGVYLSEVTPDLAELLQLPAERGAHVNQVVDGSPAAEAGLETDDVLFGWNGLPVESARQFTRMVRETPPGREVNLEVFRKGQTLSLKARIGSQPAFPSAPPRLPGPPPPVDLPGDVFPDEEWFNGRETSPAKPRLGIVMQPLTNQLAEYFGLGGRLGALVSTVMEDSAAEAAGLRAGDVIVRVKDTDVDSPMAAQRAIADAGKDGFEITVYRDRVQVQIPIPEIHEEEGRPKTSAPEGAAPDGDSEEDAGDKEEESYPVDSM